MSQYVYEYIGIYMFTMSSMHMSIAPFALYVFAFVGLAISMNQVAREGECSKKWLKSMDNGLIKFMQLWMEAYNLIT